MSGAGMVLQFSQQMKRLLAVSALIGLSSSFMVQAADTPSIPIVGPDGIVKTEPVKRYGPVKQSDTLWRVASNIRPNNRVSVYQTMLALYLKNPTAFENGNINRLMKNATLLVPNAVEIASVTDAQAKAKLRADSKAKAPTKKQNPKPKSPTSTKPPQQQAIATPVTPNTKAQPAGAATPSEAIQVKPTLTDNVRIDSLKLELEDSIASMEDILAANSRMDQQLKQLEQTVQQLQMQLQEQIKSNMMATESLKAQVDTNRLDIVDSDSTSNLAFYLASGIGGLVLIVAGVGIWLMRKSRKLAAGTGDADLQGEAGDIAAQHAEALATSDADAVAALDQLAPAGEPVQHESLDLDGSLDDDTTLPELESTEENVIHLDELDLDDQDDAPELPTDDELIAQNDLPHEEEDELDINALLNEETDSSTDDAAQAEAEPFDPDAILSNMDLDALLNDDVTEPEPEPEPEAASELDELGALEPDVDLDAEEEMPAEPELPSDELEEALAPEPAEAESTADADVELPSVEDDTATDTADAEPVVDDEPSIDMPDDIELGVDFDSLLNEPDPADVSNDGLEAVAAPDAEGGYIDIDQLLMEAESSDEGVEEFPGLEPHSNAETAEEEDGIAAKLDLARAYIEIGDFTVASDLLKEILQDGSDAQQAEANELLGRIDS